MYRHIASACKWQYCKWKYLKIMLSLESQSLNLCGMLQLFKLMHFGLKLLQLHADCDTG